MPTFETPGPIAVAIELSVGDVLLAAGERTDTVVEVRPTDAGQRDDVTAAEQTRVDYAGGRLLVKAPKTWRRFSPFSDGGSVDVRIELPAGSRLDGRLTVASVRASGRLGDCRLATAAGGIHLDQVGAFHLSTGAGDVTVGRATGDGEIETGSGAVSVAGIDGGAGIKNSNGDTRLGDVAGPVQVNAANGDITIDRARAGVTAKTANGDIRLREVSRGLVVAETGHGGLEIHVAEGVAAWLDLDTRFGNVHTDLAAAEPPPDGEASVEVRARTGFGDIAIHRRPSPPEPASSESDE